MKPKNIAYFTQEGACLLVSLFLFCLLSCSSSEDGLYINYLVPLKALSLKGQRLHIVVLDKQPDPGNLNAQEGTGPRPAIDHFTLFVRRQGTHQVERVGEYDLAGLFQAAFIKRAQYLGADVLEKPRQGVPVLVITIEQFSLALKESSWKAFIQYKGAMRKGETLVAEEVVAARKDRRHVLGQADANRLMGDLFSQVVNELDMDRFLREAAAIKE
jgi:hypothetical protein